MTHPTCALCGREADGGNHVRVTVEQIPPEQKPETHHFHPVCWDNAQNWVVR